VVRLAFRYLDSEDVWVDADAPVPNEMFGAGCIHDFSWYFEGQSAVSVRSAGEIAEWLSQCTYASDESLFQLPDFWQHPLTFEQLRRGDCDDHALWAWRKLTELGFRAELMIGHYTGETRANHAWVRYGSAGNQCILEPSSKDVATTIRPFADARAEYVPLVSVDGRLRRRLHGGFLAWLERRRLARRQKAAA
jgi:hypothetical protein